MSNKRKGSELESSFPTVVAMSSPRSVESEWEQTQRRLDVFEQQSQDNDDDNTSNNDWVSRLRRIQSLSLSESRQRLEEQADTVLESIDQDIREARAAFQQESDDVYRLQQTVEALQVDCEELQATIDDERVEASDMQERIFAYKEECSQTVNDKDRLEAERTQHVRKLKHQISLFAKTTGIKWDYDEESMLAGEVVSVRKKELERQRGRRELEDSLSSGRTVVHWSFACLYVCLYNRSSPPVFIA